MQLNAPQLASIDKRSSINRTPVSTQAHLYICLITPMTSPMDMMRIQAQIRQNATEMADYFKDLNDWEKEIVQKDKAIKEGKIRGKPNSAGVRPPGFAEMIPSGVPGVKEKLKEQKAAAVRPRNYTQVRADTLSCFDSLFYRNMIPGCSIETGTRSMLMLSSPIWTGKRTLKRKKQPGHALRKKELRAKQKNLL
jgi:hypothetical protein